MSRFFAFLRAVNAGAGRSVRMDALRRAFDLPGFSGVETFGASGNVVFETAAGDTRALEKQIEESLREVLGYEAAVLIRTDQELAEVIKCIPFEPAEIEAADQFNIIFLKDALDEAASQKVMALQDDTNELRVHGREVYWLRCKKQGGPAFTTVPFDKALPHPFTIRAAATVKKIAAVMVN